MRARTGLWEPWGSNAPGPPGPEQNERYQESATLPVEFGLVGSLWFHLFRIATLDCMTDVTNILGQIKHGDPSAAEKLLPLVYQELRKLAKVKLSQEQSGQTLQATALVHEAYLRLVDIKRVQRWESRGHFFSAAAEAMRRILVDQARHKKTVKAGGEHQRVEMSQIEPAIEALTLDLLALDDALRELEQKDPRKAELIKLRFFAGLSNQQAADVLGIAASTADLDWAYARSWLRLQMSDTVDSDG